MKKIIAILLCSAMSLALIACGGNSSSATTSGSISGPSSVSSSVTSQSTSVATVAKYPVDKVTLICPSAAGGAMDQNCRLVAPYLEKYLGASVDVVNMSGSACWVGWSYLYNEAPKDGSYISYANFPNMITGYLDTSNTTGLNNTNFDFLEMFTSDINAIVAAPNETRFKDLKSLLEYAKTNTVTIADAGARTDDAVCIAQLEKASGVSFQHVHFENTAGGMTAIQGGQVDVLVCNVSEVVEPISSGAVTGIGVVDKKASSFLPNLQCTGDLGYDLSCSSSRGFICAKGMDPTAEKLMCEAIQKAIDDTDLKAAAKKAGVNLYPLDTTEFTAWIEQQNKAIGDIFDMLD